MLDALRNTLPVALGGFDPASMRTGLVIVDEVNGFAKVGCGPLAPQAPNAQVDAMVDETDRLARRFVDEGWPVAAFLDSHHPDRPEPPYPPHCIAGTGADELVADLKWLEDGPGVALIRKDCINGFVGAIDPATGANRITGWIADGDLEAVLVVGICTDICVMDFVLTLLSARNHGLAGRLAEIVVHEPGCATYDLPKDVALSLGLPETAAHPQAEAHHMGLYMMASRGARLVDRLG